MSWTLDTTTKGRVINLVENEILVTKDGPLFHLSRDTVFQNCIIFAMQERSEVFTTDYHVNVVLINCGVSGPSARHNYLDYILN